MLPCYNFSIEDIEGEKWKDIIGYEGLYKVSNFGRVKSIGRKHGFSLRATSIIHQEINSGYCRAKLNKNGKSKKFLVHRLVLISFGKRIDGKNEVDHIDTNRMNNAINNLRWCTPKENSNFPITKKRKKIALYNTQYKDYVIEAKKHNKLCKKVAMLDNEGNVLRTFCSASEAKRELGFDVSCYCRNEYKTTYKNREHKFIYL